MARIEIGDELLSDLTTKADFLKLGFSSPTEAVKDAIRRRIEEFDSAIINRKNVKAVMLKVKKQ